MSGHISETQKRAILVITKVVKGDMTHLKFAWRYSDAEIGEISLAYGTRPCPSKHLKRNLFKKIEGMNSVDIEDERRKDMLEQIGSFTWNLLPENIQKCLNTFQGTSGLTILDEAGIPWELARIPDRSDFLGNICSVGRIHLVESILCSSAPPVPPSHVGLLIVAPTFDPLNVFPKEKVEDEDPDLDTPSDAKNSESKKWYETIRQSIQDFEGLGSRVILECTTEVERMARLGIFKKLDRIEAASNDNVCARLQDQNTIVLYLGHRAAHEKMGLKLIKNDHLTSKDIDELSAQHYAPPCLVLLMACSAGAAGHLELVDALIKWGARAVVATNWNVDDNTATDFVKFLFRRLRENSYSSIGQIFHRTVEDMALAGKGNESKLAFTLYGSPLLNLPWNQSPRLELNLWTGILDMAPNLLPSLIQSMPPGLRAFPKGLSLDELKERFEESEEEDTKVVSAMPLLSAIEILEEEHRKGKDIRVVGSMFDANAESVQVITRKERDDIKTIDDLKGKKIAVNGIEMVPTLIMGADMIDEFGNEVQVADFSKHSIKTSAATFVDFKCHADAVAALDRREADAAVVYLPYLSDYDPSKHKVIAKPMEYLMNHGMKALGQVLLARKEDYDRYKKDFEELIDRLNGKVTIAFDEQNQKGVNNVGILIQKQDVESISRFVERVVKLRNWIEPQLSQLPIPEMSKLVVTKDKFGFSSPLMVRTPDEPEKMAKRIVECLVKNMHKGEHGLLLYGAPRAGKTQLSEDAARIAKKSIHELDIVFLLKEEDESDVHFQRRFQDLLDSGFQKPTVVLVDEAEIVLGEVSTGARAVADFKRKTNSKGARKGYYLATTNHPDLLDVAVLNRNPDLRPRRLSPWFVGYPNQDERRRVIKKEFRSLKLPSDDKLIEHFAEKSSLRNYDGVKELCARLANKQKDGAPINNKLIDQLLKEVKAVDQNEQDETEELRKSFGSVGTS
jgi:hypothetical protein